MSALGVEVKWGRSVLNSEQQAFLEHNIEPTCHRQDLKSLCKVLMEAQSTVSLALRHKAILHVASQLDSSLGSNEKLCEGLFESCFPGVLAA